MRLHAVTLPAVALASALAFSPMAHAQTHRLDMATNMSRQSYLGTIVMRFADEVRKATGGTVDLKFHQDGELVPVPEILNAVSTNAVPAAFTWTGFFAGAVPVGGLFAGTPFGPDTDVWVSWMWSGGGKEILQRAMDPLNIVVLPCNPLPREAGGYFNKEINTVDDFRGLRIRFGGWGGDVLRKLGATVTAVPGSEIYVSLERGRIDATEFASPVVDEGMGFYRLARYYYFPGWHQSITWNAFIINKAAWNRLSETQRFQVETACRAMVQWSLAEAPALQMAALDRMKSRGNFEVRRFNDRLLTDLHRLWVEVINEKKARDPLTKEAHDSLVAHGQRIAAWRELQRMPATSGE